jgi:hypothetical protein
MTRVEHLLALEKSCLAQANAITSKKKVSADGYEKADKLRRLAAIYADMAAWEHREAEGASTGIAVVPAIDACRS